MPKDNLHELVIISDEIDRYLKPFLLENLKRRKGEGHDDHIQFSNTSLVFTDEGEVKIYYLHPVTGKHASVIRMPKYTQEEILNLLDVVDTLGYGNDHRVKEAFRQLLKVAFREISHE